MMQEQALKYLLEKRGVSGYSITLLAGDASQRAYYRVSAKDLSIIACHDPSLNNDTFVDHPFIAVRRVMAEGGVPVPEIIDCDHGAGLFLLEDCGDILLESLAGTCTEDELGKQYLRIIDILVKLQSIKGKGGSFSLYFDVEKLMYEFNFFITHALEGYWGISLSPAEKKSLEAEFYSIAKILDRPEISVFTHRDFHSRNILLTAGGPVVIDFQDARMGLPQYDLASLLRDSYMTLSDDLFNSLYCFYYESSLSAGLHGMKEDEFRYYFNLQAFQRNVKALGTFGYQCTVKKNNRYEKSLSTTLAYLDSYVSETDDLKKAGSMLHDLIVSHTGAQK